MAGKIFLNYRRSDSEAWADRLYERLMTQFPRDDVFMDIDGNIPLGLPWADWLDSQVAKCDLMLVLIGRAWVGEFQAGSAPGERDYVRVEIESALSRKIPVVPVFLGDASIPSPGDLPTSIRPLLDLQAKRLQRASFDIDAKSLIDGVVRSIKLACGEPYRAQGRIKVDAKDVHGAPDGWFMPGNGKTEWFKDHNAGPEMVVVPAGSFTMGSPEQEAGRLNDEGPQYKVTIAQPFAVGRFAVTFDEWDACVVDGGCNGYKPADNRGWGRGKQPVMNVNWDDAKAYATWLSRKTGKSYRLLTEAEWEYAARAGTTTPFWWGSSITPQEANYNGSAEPYKGGGSKGEYRKRTVPVDSFEANPWGLYNVHGNVSEWCEDVWHYNYNGAPTDGSARLQGGNVRSRVVRGGSWDDFPRWLRSAYRSANDAVRRSSGRGFRLARTL